MRWLRFVWAPRPSNIANKVQAQATVLQAFRIAKIEEQTTTFMKLLGPWSDWGQLLKNIGSIS